MGTALNSVITVTPNMTEDVIGRDLQISSSRATKLDEIPAGNA